MIFIFLVPTKQDGEFAWDEYRQGIILGSFFWGYVMTQIPGGRLAELFGGRKLLGYGILSTSVFTLLTPWAARASDTLLIFFRVLMGLGEVLSAADNTPFKLTWHLNQEILSHLINSL